jgi:uncharacterized protein YdhG (YjbR/CyaY superfamily)
MRSDQKKKPAGTVDEYIAAAPKDVQKTLKDLRKTIKEAAPKAQEVISYQIPTFKYHGPVVHFAAFKDHLSLFVPRISTSAKFRSRLKSHYVSGATIHFTAEDPLPKSLVKEMVRWRMKENESRVKPKK